MSQSIKKYTGSMVVLFEVFMESLENYQFSKKQIFNTISGLKLLYNRVK